MSKRSVVVEYLPLRRVTQTDPEVDQSNPCPSLGNQSATAPICKESLTYLALSLSPSNSQMSRIISKLYHTIKP